ncbi:MAG: squalene/phytoene synthase family protein [Pseudomonadota bacterium]
MSIAACAEIVRRGDPDRFMATMAGPVAARATLFPIYAFNVEVARAPWVTTEPLIAEMRVQWWRDVLDDIGLGAPPRAHEVATPLDAVARASELPLDVLDRVANAHRVYVDREGFDEADALDAFLEATGAGLMWAAAAALGAPVAQEAAVRDLGWAAGLAGYLRAIPELEAHGVRPLPDGRPEAVQALATAGLTRLRKRRGTRWAVAAHPALLAGWRSAATLRRAARAPQHVAQGTLVESEFRRRGSLLWRAITRSV